MKKYFEKLSEFQKQNCISNTIGWINCGNETTGNPISVTKLYDN
jgi:hypothetical protein